MLVYLKTTESNPIQFGSVCQKILTETFDVNQLFGQETFTKTLFSSISVGIVGAFRGEERRA